MFPQVRSYCFYRELFLMATSTGNCSLSLLLQGTVPYGYCYRELFLMATAIGNCSLWLLLQGTVPYGYFYRELFLMATSTGNCSLWLLLQGTVPYGYFYRELFLMATSTGNCSLWSIQYLSRSNICQLPAFLALLAYVHRISAREQKPERNIVPDSDKQPSPNRSSKRVPRTLKTRAPRAAPRHTQHSNPSPVRLRVAGAAAEGTGAWSPRAGQMLVLGGAAAKREGGGGGGRVVNYRAGPLSLLKKAPVPLSGPERRTQSRPLSPSL